MSLPLVFVHGYMGGKAQWNLQAPLARTHDLIFIELPGFGDNNKVPAPDTITGFADYAFAHLAKLGVAHYHLLGHSMGGMIALEMMTRAPEKIEKFILYGTAATGNLPCRFESFEASKQRIQKDGVRASARRISATWFADYEAATAYDECASIAVQSAPQAMRSSLDAMRGFDRQSALSSIKAETLIIWGEHDRTYHWDQIHQLWSEIGKAHLAVMPFCAHAAHMESPKLFNQIVSDFLKR